MLKYTEVYKELASTFTMQDTLTLRELDDSGVRYLLELTEHPEQFNKLLRACDINSLSILQKKKIHILWFHKGA